MAGKRQRGDHWEYVFKKAGVLDRPLYMTFKTEQEGDAYAKKLEALLDRGIVPAEHIVPVRVVNIEQLARQYMREAPVKSKDKAVLATVCNMVGEVALSTINAQWVDGWITDMKRVNKLAPATIRAKVGALARCCDWGVRKGLLVLPDNPLRTLPDGYAQYTNTDEALAGGKRVDVERERRLEPGEHEKILAVIEGGVLPRKQRPYQIEYKVAVRCLYVLAVETAMPLREMYTLTMDQVDLNKRTIFLDKTKNGDKRQVPLSTVAVATLKDYIKVRVLPDGLPENHLFPWWNGDSSERVLGEVTDMLSKMFHNNRNPGIFDVAGCVGLKFHDLRHEATSRLFEKTKLSESEIMKVTGHKTHRMMMRYANLRGSDLASKLW